MNEETIKVILPMRMCGERIDSSLAEMLPHLSRSKITSSIKAGLALLNNNSFKPKDKVCGNDIVTISLSQKESTTWAPEKIPLDIAYEDDDIIVINKPFGLVTHPGAGNWNGTLANALLSYDSNLSKLEIGRASCRERV